jgi:hypothetical protein
VLAILVGLSACGRLGFDESSSLPPIGDGPIIEAPRICNARVVGSLELTTERAVKLRATQLSTEWAVAIQTDAINTYMVRLAADGSFLSRHNALVGGYALQGISQLQDRPFVYVFVDTTGYIKLLAPDWESYDTGPSSELFSMDPQQVTATTGDYAITGAINGGQLLIQGVDVNNVILGQADYSPAASFASFGATPIGARVVVEHGGTCESFEIDDDGPTGPRHTFGPCYEPRLATLGHEGAVLYRTSPDGPLALHQIPAVASDPGTTTSLEVGSNPRIATINGEIWFAYLRGSGQIRLVRLSGDSSASHDDDSIATSFDLVDGGAFWVTAAGELHTGEPCL